MKHVCSCGDCNPAAYVDRCKFEQRAEYLLATLKRLTDFLVGQSNVAPSPILDSFIKEGDAAIAKATS